MFTKYLIRHLIYSINVFQVSKTIDINHIENDPKVVESITSGSDNTSTNNHLYIYIYISVTKNHIIMTTRRCP